MQFSIIPSRIPAVEVFHCLKGLCHAVCHAICLLLRHDWNLHVFEARSNAPAPRLHLVLLSLVLQNQSLVTIGTKSKQRLLRLFLADVILLR